MPATDAESLTRSNWRGLVSSSCSVLFACADSVYNEFPVEVYDIERDALTFPGGMPVVAHPPCRAWASLRHCAKPRDGEKEYAIWAIDQVRREGGVLEHPICSVLWREAGLPEGVTDRDGFGGFEDSPSGLSDSLPFANRTPK